MTIFPGPTTRAVILIPAGADADRWRDECWAYCERCGYEVATIVAATADGWRTALEMWAVGQAEVIVAYRRGHLPAERVPRVEIVTEEPRRQPGARRTVRRYQS